MEDLGDSLKVIIQSNKHWPQVFLFCVMFVPWAIVGIGGGAMLGLWLTPLASDIASHAQNTANLPAFAFIALFSLTFLGLWVMVGTSRLYSIFWHIAGKEVVHVTPKSLVLCRQVFGLGHPHEYLIDHLSDLRVALVKNCRWNAESLWLFTDGSIMFDYGAETWRFGSDLGATDATQIVDTIKRKFPQYRIKRPAKHRVAKRKYLATLWLIVVGTVFLAGGIARTLQQTTGAEWLESMVRIFGGLFTLSLGLPFFFTKQLNTYAEMPLSIPRIIFSWLIGIPVTLLGIGLTLWGTVSLWVSLH